MRFIEIPALITEDIEDPSIVDITEPITVSISGTTMTIDGGSKVSGEATVTLTGDTTVNAFTLQNIKHPSLHKISVKTGRKGNFTYVPTDTVTASSVSTTTKTGSDFEILLITTNGGETYVDFDMADYTSPALYTSNALTGFDISELTSTYGATAKLYKPGETLPLTTVSATTGGGIGFGSGVESIPGDVTYTLEVTDDLGRTSRYDLPRKWISYAMSSPGFEKLELAGNEYTTTTIVPNISPSSKAKVFRTNNHGYLGINFKIQGRNSTGDDWVDIANADEDDEVLAFGDFLYHRVWVKPTAKATTTVSSSNVVTLTLTDFTEENVTTSFDNFDPYDINESTNTYVFEETTKIGTVPFTVTLGTETYTNAVSATTEKISGIQTKTFHTDVTESNILYKHLNRPGNAWQVSGSVDAKWLTYSDGSGNPQFYKGSPESGYTLIQTVSNGQGSTGTLSYDGLYHIGNNHGNTNATLPILKRTGDTFAAHSSDLTKHASVNYGPIAWSPNSYNFAVTDSENEKIYFYEFDSSNETWSTTWNSGSLTSTIGDISWFGRMSARLSKDGEYFVTGDHSPENTRIFKCDWTTQTVTLQHTQIGNSGAAAIDYDGEYVITGYNSANTKILKRSDTTWTDVTTSEGFTNLPYIRTGAQFLGVPSQYLLTGEYNTPGQTASQYHTFMYKWKTKNSVTLTFSNPTLTLTGQNVTISSAKLYRDDVLFHTYGTESNVVLRSDQTGTYQAIVNDVYYSNRVTPDFTTTRSVSAPQLEFDGYNRLNLSNSTPTSTTLGLPDGTTRDLTTQSNVYIYETGTYTANVQTSDTFAYLSNVVTSQPSQNSADVGPTFTFDGYNRLNLSNLTQTSSSLRFGSNTYDTNTASNVYVTDAGEYKLEARDANTFVMSNVYVDAVDTTTFTLAFHHGAFSASDYSGAYSTVGAAATAGFVYSDTTPATYTWGTLNSVDTSTTGQTGYTWTPTSDITADVLMVAGGGGGSDSNGGGGGAGGLVYNASQNLSGTKTIVVGAGGTKGIDWHDTGTFAEPGGNTSFTGLDTAIGGGAGTQYTNYPDSGTRRNGGSGGGAAGSSDNNLDSGGTGISGQGYAGGGGKRYSGGGGGGAGGAGGDGVYDGDSGSGGVGLDYSSIFGTTYGDDGWFAGGGAGATGGTASGGKGGGGDGGDATGSSRVAAQAHTGGGGSGGSGTTYPNSDGGSGIVLIKKLGPINPPALTFDGYNKLTIENDGNGDTGMKNVTISGGPWDNHTFKPDDNAQKGKFQWDLWLNTANYQIGNKHNLEYVPGYGWYVLNQDGTGFGDVTPTSATSGTYLDGNGVSQTFSTNLASSSGGVLSIAHTAGTMTVNESDFFEGGIFPPKVGSLESVTIKKDGVAFATTTSNTVYIRDTGTYTAEVKGSGAYAIELSNVVTGTVSQHPADVVPSLTYDNYNKITLENMNYEDTATVTVPNESTYNLGTAKTMYVKDTGEYVFKISGTDKYAESNVYVSSVDLAGAPTKPIDFDGYNKLTLIDAGSNVSANVTYFSNTYELGSANVLYINGAGTYDLEMSGSNVFALSSNVVSGSVNSGGIGPPISPIAQSGTDADGVSWTNLSWYYDESVTTSNNDGHWYYGESENNGTTIASGNNGIKFNYTNNTWHDANSSTRPYNLTYNTSNGLVEYHEQNNNLGNAYFTSPYFGIERRPSLTFDGYNKLTLENFTTSESDTRTATLTVPNGNTYSLGQTQNDIYIEDTGEYILEVTNSDQSAVVKTNVGTISDFDPSSQWTKVIQMGVKHNISSDVYSNGVTGTKSNWLNGVGTYNTASDDNYVLTWDRTSVKKFLWRGRDGAWEILFSNDVLDNFTSYWSSDRHYLPVISGKGTVNLDTAGSVDVSTITHMEVFGYGHSSATYPQMYFTNNGHHSGRVGNFSWMESSYGWDRDNLWGTNHQGFEVLVSTSDTAGHLIDAVSPSLTFDGYNKLSIENLTLISSSLRFGSNTYDIGTASNVYIEDAGTYKVATGDANTFVLVSNVVGTVSQHPEDVVPSLTYDASNKLSIENLTPTSTTLTDPNGSSFDIGTATDVYIRDSGTYSIASKDANTFLLASNTVTGTPTGTTYVYDSNTFTTPSQTYDTTKTITVSNVPSHLSNVVGKIYKGSTAYTIHATTSSSNVIIENTGTYVSVFTTATQAFLTNAIDATQPTPTSDDTTIEDAVPSTSVDITLAFHYADFVATDYNSAYATKEAAAADGFVYADTPDGTYSWGTLTVTSNTTSNTQYTWAISGTGIVDYLVVAGGGAGGNDRAGGGGAGGYRTSVSGDLSGGSTSPETPLSISSGTYSIIVGNGGQWGGDTGDTNPGPNGNDSVFHTITSLGGGGGASEHAAPSSGGSGGGGAYYHSSIGNNGTAGQGTSGASGYENFPSERRSGGGGGASSAANLKDGGDGLSSTITGTPVIRGGGGGAGDNRDTIGTQGPGSGGSGGGGDGGLGAGGTGSNGVAHTGGGGGGGGVGNDPSQGGDGGSGIVIIKYTGTTTTVGFAGSTAVPDETTTDAPSVTLDVAATTTEDPILDLDFTTTLPRTLKRYNGVTNSSIGARFNRRESRKKRIEKSISIPTSFSAELTANNASSPTTLTVTVANSKFVINGDETPTLGFIRGETYTFDQSDASNSGHPLVLATSEDGTQYTTGWTTTPSSDYIPGVSGTQGTFIVPYDVPDTIYYKCTNHAGMGGAINTTFGNTFSLGDFTVAANTHVSGEYTLSVNYDGTTSNLYVNGFLITQTTPSPAISAGVKDFILGKEFDGYVKNFKFWNYAKRFRPPGIYPQTLPSLDSTSLFHAYLYTWRKTEGTLEVYDIKVNDGSDNQGQWWSDVSNDPAYYHAIAVDTTTNTWEDYGPSHPFEEPVENADGTILVTDGPTGSYPNLYKFTKPTDASWID
jgi:hypothetical protein